MWNSIRPRNSDSLFKYFKPVAELLAQGTYLEKPAINYSVNKHLNGAYYFYNEKYDRLLIIYPPTTTPGVSRRSFLDRATSYSELIILHRWYEAIRKCLNKPCIKIVELEFRDTVLDENQIDKVDNPDNPWMSEIIEQSTDENAKPETREENENPFFYLEKRNWYSRKYLHMDVSGLVYLVRKLQYLCDQRDISDKVKGSDLFSSMTVNSRIISTRMNLLKSEKAVNEILDNTENERFEAENPQINFTASSLRRDLVIFKKIYAERIKLGQRYLGKLGFFGSYTAQEKYDALDKFLKNELAPLDPAAKQGELGKLIKTYQEAIKTNVLEVRP